MIQIPRNNGNTINDSNNTAFGKPSSFVTRDSSHYILLDSDMLQNIGDLI